MRTSRLALLALFAILACNRNAPPPGPPDAPVTPSAAWFGGAPPPTNLPPSAPPSGADPSATVPASASAFVKTQDSDEWVRKTFSVAPSYNRILVVTTGAISKLSVPKLDLNGAGPATEVTPITSYRTIQDAVDAAKGGDLVAVMPGRYAGFFVGDRADLGDGKYLHVRAFGAPGEVVIDKPQSRDPKWAIYLQTAHHVIVEGFAIAGKSSPGEAFKEGTKAGVMINGNFPSTGKLAHHIAIVNVFSHHQGHWGLHAVDSHTVLVQDSVFAYSGREHGAYVSDGSDNYVLRRNVFFGNFAGGLQVNLDPEASLEKLVEHADMKSAPKDDKSRKWAIGILETATKRFGENGFPDGRGVNFIIERNVMNGNGKLGGGALNLAAMSESLIQNNLMYGNFAHGIAQWDNRNPYDEAAREAPAGAAEDALPLFGCRNNLVRHNTVLMDKSGRAALQSANGSFGTRAYDNILINDHGASIEVSSTSLSRLDLGVNVVNEVEGVPATFTKLVRGVTRASAAPGFVRSGEEPWIVVEGSWWKLNPQRPDFKAKPGGMFAGKADKGSDLGALP